MLRMACNQDELPFVKSSPTSQFMKRAATVGTHTPYLLCWRPRRVHGGQPTSANYEND